MHDDGQQRDQQQDTVLPSSQETVESDGDPGEDAVVSLAPGSPSDQQKAVSAADEPEPSVLSNVANETATLLDMPEGDPELTADEYAVASAAPTASDVPAEATAGLDPDRWLLQQEHAAMSKVLAGAAPAPTGELEEITLPSSVTTLDPLEPGTVVGHNGQVAIDELTERRGRVNHYRGTFTTTGEPLTVEVLEAPEDHDGVMRTVEVLEQVRYAMLPSLRASWVAEGRRYLAIDHLESRTLDESFDQGMVPEDIISVVLQLAQALRRLHGAGWALVGLSPDGVRLGQPLQITQLGTATRIGESTTAPLHIVGFSAPELVEPTSITGKEDVYTLGAILYRGLTGQAIPEAGPELSNLSATLRTPAVPQLLFTALGPAEERVDLETFYQGLLALKRRLSARPIALRIASGTSIGLNQTRQANEDACGYLTWSSAWEGRVAYSALLCMIDGMGGMEAGEVAATSALRSVLRRAGEYAADRIANAPGIDIETTSRLSAEATVPGSVPATGSLDLHDLVQGAAEAAFAAGQGRQVGATITCVSIEDGILRLGHVGDTRAYLLRDGVLTRLTRDHSLVAAMVASGVITPEEAEHHPESNKVLRSLGGMRRLPPGYIDDLAIAHGHATLDLRDGDQLLLCSDGIWGVINDDGLLGLLNDLEDCETVVASAIALALERGAPDNAAIIVARCSTMPAS